MTVLRTWRQAKSRQATGEVLFDALVAIKKRDVVRFGEELLGQGWEPSASTGEDSQQIMSAADGACAAPDVGASRGLPDELLLEMSGAFHNQDQCIDLAVKLKIGEDDVFKLLAVTFDERMAYNIIKKWMKAKNEEATGFVLHPVLCDIKRRDLADRFEQGLLMKDSIPAESEAKVRVSNATESDLLVSEQNASSEVIPSIELLQQIADYLPKHKHCVRLADSLGLGEDFVKRLKERKSTSNTATLNVLRTWKQQKSKRATGKALFNALVAINKRDVAAGFAEELLGQEVVDWEDYCYDDEHRAFFRLLRRKCIDVLCVYENMSCSEYFLRHLHQQSVINSCEYDELSDSSRTPRKKSALNKKLMGFINQKPLQLQELFADQLCRYQAEFVMVDKETTKWLDISCPEDDEAVVNTPYELQEENILVDFKEELVRRYNQLLIVRPLDFAPSENFQPVNDAHVTLSSISYEEALNLIQSPQQLCGSQLLTAVSQVDAESKHSKELVDLHSLLCSDQGAWTKRTVLFGSAGSGKSLTTLKILSEWNSKNSTSPFKQFEVVVYVTGKERSRISANNVYDLWRLQQMGFNNEQEIFILKHFSEHSEKVLFLVDGWEEAGNMSLLQEDTIMKKILCGDLFPESAVIITTRPAPNAYPLLEKCKNRYSLVGFNDKRLQELFSRRLSESKASQLFDALCQSSHLHVKSAVQKSPLFASMLVEVYKMDETLPSTITALYQLVLESIRCRYVQWIIDTQTSSASEVVRVNDKAAKANFDEAERKVSKLALVGLMRNRVTFTGAEVLLCGQEAIKHRFGLLTEMKEAGKEGSDVHYYFNHMTWQEYLGARSLATDPDFIRKMRLCVRSIGVGEHTHMFWRFLAGLLSPRLLADVVFKLLQASGVCSVTPWETEFRLFLMGCIAENVRLRQMVGEESTTNLAMQLVTAMTNNALSQFTINGCMLDMSNLSSMVIFLKVCIQTVHFSILNCRFDHQCPALSNALLQVKKMELMALSGSKSSAFVQTVISSVTCSCAITEINCGSIKISAECMLTFAQLINASQSLTDVNFYQCEIGLAGLSCWNRSIFHGSSLSSLRFYDDNFGGCGALLGQPCSRLPQLRLLSVQKCSLDDNDAADILTGLQNNLNIQFLEFTCNNLTDELISALVQFASWQNDCAERNPELPSTCWIIVGGNRISEGMLRQLAFMLPLKSNVMITNGLFVCKPMVSGAMNPVTFLRRGLEDCTDGCYIFEVAGAGDHVGIHLAEILKTDDVNHIQTIKMASSDIGDGTALALAEVLPQLRLEGLNLCCNRITIVGFHRLLSAISKGCSLQHLNVSQNAIFYGETASARQLKPSILSLSRSVSYLKVLCMRSTSCGNECGSLENSVVALMAISSLSALDLSNNHITDHSIAMVTEYMGNMAYLSLSENRISCEGGKAIIAMAKVLAENAEAKDTSTRLQRLWLGGNSIAESVFAECNCRIISSESVSMQNVAVDAMQAMFSASAIGVSQERHYQSLLVGIDMYSPFLARIKAALLSKMFVQFMDQVINDKDGACFDRWFMRSLCAISYRSDSETFAYDYRSLHMLFTLLTRCHIRREAVVPSLAVSCCMLCVIDELMITYDTAELQHDVEQSLNVIMEFSRLDSDFFLDVVQFISSLAERCRRRQLHSVAELLLQQMDLVSQQAWIYLHSSI